MGNLCFLFRFDPVTFNRSSTEPQGSQVVSMGSAETDQSCLGQNSQPQFCAIVAIKPLGSLHRVP